MKKSKKILLIISVVSIFIGASMMLGAWCVLRNNAADAVAGLEFEEKSHVITDSFTKININTINSSIELLPSADGVCRIVCSDNEKLYHRISVAGSQLNINQHDDWQWYEMLYGLFRKDNLSLRVYLPEAEYGLLHAHSSSGDITIAPDFRFQTANTYTASGNTKVTALYAENLTVCSVSGDLILRDLEAAEDAFIESISGFTQVENLKAANITTHASSGSTVLENLSSDYLRATSVSGEIRMFNGNFRNTSHFETSSGNIEIVDSACGEQAVDTVSGNITLQNVSGSSLNVRTSSGSISLFEALYSGRCLCNTVSSEIVFYGLDAEALELFSSSGDISGNLLSSKNFITETGSGLVIVPPSDEESGTCYVSTVSGNINIAIDS